MAFVSVAGGGTGAIAGSSASSFTITTTAAIDLSSSRFALVAVSSDNRSTSDGSTNDHTSVTGGTGTWTKLGEYTNTVGGAAADGVTTSLWLFVPSGANAIGTVFTVNLSGNVVDAAAQVRIFTWDTTKGIRQTTEAAIVGNGVDASTGFGSAAYSGLTSLARLYFRAMGKEANSTTNVTPSTSFSAGTATRSRNNAAAILSRTEWRINTSTGETSNPTLAVSGDTASLFAAIEEFTPGGNTTVTITAATAAHTGQAFTVNAKRLSTMTAASLLLAGVAFAVLINRVVAIAAGTASWAGQAFTTKRNRAVAIAAGLAAYAGQSLALGGSRFVSLLAAGLQWTGRALAVTMHRIVQVGYGLVTFVGRIVTSQAVIPPPVWRLFDFTFRFRL